MDIPVTAYGNCALGCLETGSGTRDWAILKSALEVCFHCLGGGDSGDNGAYFPVAATKFKWGGSTRTEPRPVICSVKFLNLLHHFPQNQRLLFLTPIAFSLAQR